MLISRILTADHERPICLSVRLPTSGLRTLVIIFPKHTRHAYVYVDGCRCVSSDGQDNGLAFITVLRFSDRTVNSYPHNGAGLLRTVLIFYCDQGVRRSTRRVSHDTAQHS